MQLDLKFAFDAPHSPLGLSLDAWQQHSSQALTMVSQLNQGLGDCSDKGIKMLGWQHYAHYLLANPQEITRIQEIANNLKDKCEIVFIVGIGGSYLGAKAIIEAIYGPNFNHFLSPQIYFLGNNTDPQYLDFCLKQAERHSVGVIAISKSGTTLEPALALRTVLPFLGEKESDLRDRLIVITDAHQGVLHDFALEHNLTQLIIPDDIGGRFSVMTPVGLLPLTLADIDPINFLEGIASAQKWADDEQNFAVNLSAQLATWRFMAMQAGAVAEYQVTNSQSFRATLDWVAQLECESEGHHGHGLHLVPALFPQELHSLGQLIQQGPRHFIEIATRIQTQFEWRPETTIWDNFDGLDYLATKKTTFETINQAVIDGALSAHYHGGIPSAIIDFGELNAFNWGQYVYFMMKATAINGYLLGHNPFIQPGVQAWKDSLNHILH